MEITKRRIIDADGHVAEDAAAIIARMPQAYRDKAREQPFNPFPPFDHLHAGHLVDMPPGAFNRKVGPKEWLEFLDEVGIDTTVLYPTAGVASANIVNADWAVDATRAYNDWLSDTYVKHSPRFRGLALLPQPVLNPQAAADELRRAVTQLRMCGAVIPSNSLHAPPLGTPTYFPIYQAANELGCCVAIHGGVHGNMGMDGLDPYAAVHAIGHPLGQMISLASLVFNGVFEKFPKIRFGFLEGGVAWFLFCLERFDRSYDTQHHDHDPDYAKNANWPVHPIDTTAGRRRAAPTGDGPFFCPLLLADFIQIAPSNSMSPVESRLRRSHPATKLLPFFA